MVGRSVPLDADVDSGTNAFGFTSENKQFCDSRLWCEKIVMGSRANSMESFARAIP